MKTIGNEFITDLTWSYLKSYFSSEQSLFRRYQDHFLARFGSEIDGRVLEIGSEPQYHHERFFPNASAFVTSNISAERGQVDRLLDVTNMGSVASDSQDAIVATSVLEHVPAVERAAREIERVLRPGGKLLLTVPYAFPYHDEVDYWRLSKDGYRALFPNLEVLALTHLGGLFSSCANVLQRPAGLLTARYAVYKVFGLVIGILGSRLDTEDGFPLGYGLYATKR